MAGQIVGITRIRSSLFDIVDGGRYSIWFAVISAPLIYLLPLIETCIVVICIYSLDKVHWTKFTNVWWKWHCIDKVLIFKDILWQNPSSLDGMRRRNNKTLNLTDVKHEFCIIYSFLAIIWLFLVFRDVLRHA